MRRDACGQGAIRAIVVMGAVVAVLLLLVALGLNLTLSPDEGERVGEVEARTAFDGARAYAHAEELVALGPRPPGSEGAAAARAYITDALKAMRLFATPLPHAATTHLSLYAEAAGQRPGLIIVAAPYTTAPDVDTEGANFSAAPSGWLLELARVVGRRPPGMSVGFTWLGDMALDAQGGAEALAGWLNETGRAARVHSVVQTHLIGDCYLSIAADIAAPPAQRQALWDTVQRQGYREHFGRMPQRVSETPLALRAAGLPVVTLWDLRYGGSVAQHAQLLHSPEDTLEKVCAGSLQAVGDVLYASLAALEAAPKEPPG